MLGLFSFMAVTFICRGQSVFTQFPALKPAYVNNFSANNNLPQSCVSDVLEDDKGRLWVASCQGMAGLNSVRLLQFDGYNFYPINLANDSLPNRTMAILKGTTPSGSIFGILETAKLNAIFLFDPERQTTRTISFDEEKEGTLGDIALQPDNSILTLVQKKDSLFLYRVNWPDSKQMILTWHMGKRMRDFENFDFSMASIGDEAFIVSNVPPCVFHVNLLERSCQIHPMEGVVSQTSFKQVRESFNDKSYNGFVAAATGELFCLIPQARSQVYLRRVGHRAFEAFDELPAGYAVCRMEPDAYGNILFLLQNQQGEYAAILRDQHGRLYDYSAFVSGHAVTHNIRSRNFFNAVFVCADDGFFYKTIEGSHKDVRCFPSDSGIRAMLELGPGRFYITAENSKPTLYERATGKTTDPDPGSPWMQAFGRAAIRKFMNAPDGSIWTFRGDTLVRFDPTTSTHRDYAAFSQIMIYEMLSDGRIAYCTFQHQNVYFFDPATGKSTLWKDNSELRPMKGFVHDIKQAKDGTLWVLTTNGLMRLNLSTGKETVLGFQAPFRDSRFLCMAEATDGKLWLGTFLGGVHIYDPKSGSVKVVDKDQGLPSNSVAFILPDGKGNFLAGTYNGLSHLSPEGVVRGNFFKEEGFCVLEFNRYACLQTSDGSFLLGTVKGVHDVSSDLLKGKNFSDQPPRMFLTLLRFTDPVTGMEKTYREDLANLPLLTLPPEHRDLHVRFALSSYVQSDRNQFAYMLEGLDEHWTYIGAKHDLNLSNLPPGRYTLLITGCDFQGNCSTTPIRIPIYAREFFYKQWWFYLLCSLPFIAFAFAWLRRLRNEKKRLEKEVQRRTKQIQSDKTLIEQQARELLQLDEAKSRFFTNISHELRTPITLITAPVEHLIQKFHPGQHPDEERQSLQWVLYNGRKLAALVEELLELSRLEAGKTELFETPTEFFPWCRQLFSAFESQAQMKRIRYVFDYQANPALTLGVDRKRLEKIINNLISNALKFTQPDGEVKVIILEQASNYEGLAQINLQVMDTGRGIPTEDIPHLFERYFQTKRNDLAKAGGTGIGLALAKELALLMKGDLTVESEWGSGSVFNLSLPLKKMSGIAPLVPEATPEVVQSVDPVQMSQPEMLTPPVPSNGQKSGKDHVLLVEDNPDMQALLQSLLSADYQLTVANDGQEAWDMLENDALREHHFSLILSDVMMPRMDGYELLAKLKSHERYRQTPVILLTARAEQDDKIQALRLGVDDYLVKPFSPPELSARVSNLIANYRSRQAFSEKTVPDISFEKVDAQDELWLKNIESSAKNALDKGLPLQVGDLAAAGMMSERQFFREIKRLTGLTPNQYIQEVRLQKARHLLQHRAYNTLAEVAYAVGFDTPSYFTKVFEQHFGKHPSAYFQQRSMLEPGVLSD